MTTRFDAYVNKFYLKESTKSANIIKNKLGILSESQNFDFEKHKFLILRFIQKVKNDEKLAEHDNPFYKLIAGDVGGSVGSYKNLGFSQEESKQWKNYFSLNVFDTNGVWSQRNINGNLPRKSGDRTYNYYISITKNKNNILKFWNKLGQLDVELQKLSNNTKIPISYKTHSILDAFLAHNDSLKIYYYAAHLKPQIENIVKEWLNTNGISQGDRTHYHGVDKPDITGKKRSFGEILSNVVADQLIDAIKQNPNVEDEKWFEWIKKYTPSIIRKIQIQYT